MLQDIQGIVTGGRMLLLLSRPFLLVEVRQKVRSGSSVKVGWNRFCSIRYRYGTGEGAEGRGQRARHSSLWHPSDQMRPDQTRSNQTYRGSVKDPMARICLWERIRSIVWHVGKGEQLDPAALAELPATNLLSRLASPQEFKIPGKEKKRACCDL